MRYFWLGSAVLLVVLTAVIIRQTQYALTLQTQVQEALTPTGKTELYGKAFLETISFGLYDGASTEVAARENQIGAWQQAQRLTRLATGAFVLISLLVVASVLMDGRTHGSPLIWHLLSIHALGLSFLLFVLGVATPLVTMTTTGTVPGLGSALMRSTTKGIMTAIGDLWASHPVLALLVLVFSVVLPLVKLSLAAWVLMGAQLPRRVVRVLQIVGKWSMADVFVVAVLIVLMTPIAQGRVFQTSMQAGIGLYFFAASYLLSLFTTRMIGRSTTTRQYAPGPVPHLRGAGDDA